MSDKTQKLNLNFHIDDPGVIEGLYDLERELGHDRGNRRFGKRTVARLLIENAIKSGIGMSLLFGKKKSKP